MHWYYDNEGIAEGPHDDEVMASHLKEGRISTETLIWQPDLEAWAELNTVNPAWSVKALKPRSKTASVLLKLTGGIPARSSATAEGSDSGMRRSPTPLAPSGGKTDSAKGGGFLKRIFKLGRKDG